MARGGRSRQAGPERASCSAVLLDRFMHLIIELLTGCLGTKVAHSALKCNTDPSGAGARSPSFCLPPAPSPTGLPPRRPWKSPELTPESQFGTRPSLSNPLLLRKGLEEQGLRSSRGAVESRRRMPSVQRPRKQSGIRTWLPWEGRGRPAGWPGKRDHLGQRGAATPAPRDPCALHTGAGNAGSAR